jgi:predicted  nucleic acid-binding Zn-ribbon protein
LRKNLKLLGELQEIDLKVDGLQGEKEGLLAEIAGLEQQVASVQSEIAAKNGELVALEEEKQRLEENLAAETDNIARSEGRLKEIKTQKEYQAVSKEISTAKKLKAELEEQILQKIGQIEEFKGDIAGREENLGALEKNVAGQKAEVQKKIEQLEAAIAADTTAREAAVKGLPASVMRRYSLLREQRRGVAVVEARDGYCLGCNMQLPPQLYNTLFRGDELITCPHCQRVLLLRQEDKD